MPFPTLEIDCGTLGGTSGGAVLDSEGQLVGVTSRGMETAEGDGPSSAAWIIGALNQRLEITWPPGLYRWPIHVLEIDQLLLRIEGREYFKIFEDGSVAYRTWSERRPPTLPS